MYTIILVSALFLNAQTNKPHQVESQQTFITKEACTNLAWKMTEATGLEHRCIKVQNPRSI